MHSWTWDGGIMKVTPVVRSTISPSTGISLDTCRNAPGNSASAVSASTPAVSASTFSAVVDGAVAGAVGSAVLGDRAALP